MILNSQDYKKLLKQKSNKCFSQRVIIDGINFASMKESNRYLELKKLEKLGIIENLERQVKFPLCPAVWFDTEKKEWLIWVPMNIKKKKNIHCVKLEQSYIADFAYFDCKSKQMIFEDVKGYRPKSWQKPNQYTKQYREFLRKKRLVKTLFGIDIQEV